MRRRLRMVGTMDVQQCMTCRHFWANNSGPRHTFEVVTRVCPDCVSQQLPVMGEARDEAKVPA